MSIVPRRSQSFTPPTKGFHEAAIAKVEEVDIVSPFDDPDDPKPKIKIHFRLTDELRENGEPHEFSELYTNSLFEKSKLYQHLVGAGLTAEDVQDLEDLVGLIVRVNVGHRESKKGGTFPKVLSLAPSENGKSFVAREGDVPF
ncbi:MAG: hypothetical protein ACRD21_15420 [Vicinamibacteria bacterium]